MAMLAAAMRPLHAVNGLMRARPLTASIVVTTVKAGLADMLVQKVIEQRKELDKRRLATFLVFGSCYQGCFAPWMQLSWPQPPITAG